MAPLHIETIQELIEQVQLETKTLLSSSIDLQFQENLKSTERQLNDLQINETKNAIDPTTRELEEKLAQVKAEWQTITTESDDSELASLTKEKARLDQVYKETGQEIETLEDEIRALRLELSELEQQDDEQQIDSVSLQLALYRGLGVRMVAKNDKFVTALLLSDDKFHKVNSIDISNNYSPAYLSKLIWEFISM